MGELSRADLYGIEKKLTSLESMVGTVDARVSTLDQSISGINSELKSLREDFLILMEEQDKKAALQEATTELIRVRQEMHKKFGKYQLVRESMIGVLQATDSALVRKETIATVTEELMISAPKYWLAPCLIAVSAWISNDRNLAERAIKEAVKRDREKTALAMALICRRNRREKTCHEWLAIYFSEQKGNSLKESTFAYIDAYINGIFGKDEKGECEDYIYGWFNRAKASRSNFEESQGKFWKEYFTGGTVSIEEDYPELYGMVKEYKEIDAYLSRIKTAPFICNYFSELEATDIDEDELREKIDQNLIDLVNRYDEEEMPFIEDEERYQLIKEYRGDDKKARTILAARKAKKLAMEQNTLDMIGQMNNTIVSPVETSISKQKTSVSFLKNYINIGFKDYISENKSLFPSKITMDVYGFNAETETGENIEDISRRFDKYMEVKRQEELAALNTSKPKKYMIAGIVSAVLAIPALITIVFGIILLALAGFFFYKMIKAKKEVQANIDELNAKINQMKIDGKQKINGCIEQWLSVNKDVSEFENKPLLTVVA